MMIVIRRQQFTLVWMPTICGALYDIYAYKTGGSVNHGHNGAEMARVVLKRRGDLFQVKQRWYSGS